MSGELRVAEVTSGLGDLEGYLHQAENLGMIPEKNASWKKSHEREMLFAFGANEKYIWSQA